jgi:hypothetical protein
MRKTRILSRYRRQETRRARCSKSRLRAREQEIGKWLHPAADMYTGRRHTQIMDAVRILRSVSGQTSCHSAIVSAGYESALNVLKHKSPGMAQPCKGIRG